VLLRPDDEWGGYLGADATAADADDEWGRGLGDDAAAADAWCAARFAPAELVDARRVDAAARAVLPSSPPPRRGARDDAAATGEEDAAALASSSSPLAFARGVETLAAALSLSQATKPAVLLGRHSYCGGPMSRSHRLFSFERVETLEAFAREWAAWRRAAGEADGAAVEATAAGPLSSS